MLLHSLNISKTINKKHFSKSINKEEVNTFKDISELHFWHKKLGHPNAVVLQKVLSSCKSFKFNKNLSPSFCNACQHGKAHKLSFKEI